MRRAELSPEVETSAVCAAVFDEMVEIIIAYDCCEDVALWLLWLESLRPHRN